MTPVRRLAALAVVPVALVSLSGGWAVLALALPGDDQQGDSTAGLSLRQLAGQRTVYAFSGRRPPPPLLKRLRRGEAAGVILFGENIGSRRGLRAMVARMQVAARRSSANASPLLVMIDQEGGMVKRLSGAPHHSPAELGRIGRGSLARREGQATARNLRSVGVNVDLAPVVDTGRRGSFQQETERSYSSDPRRVAKLGSEFVRGLQEKKVAATLKHFAGLGLVRRNEDSVVQRVPLSRRRLRAVDELPFERGIDAGAKLVMTSTAIYPAIDSRPALLSRRVVGEELRKHLHFDGVTITDSLTVPALRRYGSPARLGVKAALAGNDLLLFGSYGAAVGGLGRLVAAARRHEVTGGQLRDSARRVLELRASFR